MVNLFDWLMKLCLEKLPLYQAVTVSENLIMQIYKELTERKYTVWNRLAAEKWILEGNWQYKKIKTLTVADFYPSEDQLKVFDEFLPMSVINDYMIEFKRKYHNENMLKIERKYEEKFFNKQISSKDILTGMRENASLTVKNIELKEQIFLLTQKNQMLLNKIDKLEKQALQRR